VSPESVDIGWRRERPGRVLAIAGALLALSPAAVAHAATSTTTTTSPSGHVIVTTTTTTGVSPAAIAIAIVAAIVAIGCLSWAVARRRAFEPRWLLSLRHTFAEAGFRASETWSELGDWLRLGR
jgi:hypothetical protein